MQSPRNIWLISANSLGACAVFRSPTVNFMFQNVVTSFSHGMVHFEVNSANLQ